MLQQKSYIIKLQTESGVDGRRELTRKETKRKKTRRERKGLPIF